LFGVLDQVDLFGQRRPIKENQTYSFHLVSLGTID
jgi:hypothetical protein